MMLSRLAGRMRRDLRRLINREALNTATIIVRSEPDPGAFDVNLEADLPASDPEEVEMKAMVHFFGERSIQFSGGEIESGDAVLVFPDAAVLPKVSVFVIEGREYVQKNQGGRLLEDWDLVVSGQRFARTVFVQRKR